MEEAIGIRYDNQDEIRGQRAMVRYADDLVVFCESKEDAERVSQLIQSWLKDRGLTLSSDKTRTLYLAEGFDFLGFNIRHYRAPQTSKSGYKLLIKHSKESVQDFKHCLKRQWLSLKGTNANAVIRRLNPIIRGWANHFRVGVSSEVFSDLDYWINYRARRWAKFSHSTKPKKWWQRKYWGRFHPRRNDRWMFGDKNSGSCLLKLSWFPVERHVLVKGAASPDDPELKEYWRKRAQRKASNLKPRRRRLAEAQKGKCVQCGATLFNGEELQEHHIISRSEGGRMRSVTDNLYTSIATIRSRSKE
jgi:RNA-directed DNA polymerase